MAFSMRAFVIAVCHDLALASYPTAMTKLPFRQTRTQVPRDPARSRFSHALDKALLRQTLDVAYFSH